LPFFALDSHSRIAKMCLGFPKQKMDCIYATEAPLQKLQVIIFIRCWRFRD
jgi:hypothetical protein